MGKVRMVVALVGLVAGCGRTVTGPPPCNVQPITAPIVGVAGDTATAVTVYFCGVR